MKLVRFELRVPVYCVHTIPPSRNSHTAEDTQEQSRISKYCTELSYIYTVWWERWV